VTVYDDDFGAEMEAIETARMDADLAQAEMERAGNAFHAARKAGRCVHGGAVGYLPDPVYPEQVGLKPGQLRCTDGCGAVFASDEDWLAAIDQAVYG
jgi:hypothetical protein